MADYLEVGLQAIRQELEEQRKKEGRISLSATNLLDNITDIQSITTLTKTHDELMQRLHKVQQFLGRSHKMGYHWLSWRWYLWWSPLCWRFLYWWPLRCWPFSRNARAQINEFALLTTAVGKLKQDLRETASVIDCGLVHNRRDETVTGDEERIFRALRQSINGQNMPSELLEEYPTLRSTTQYMEQIRDVLQQQKHAASSTGLS